MFSFKQLTSDGIVRIDPHYRINAKKTNGSMYRHGYFVNHNGKYKLHKKWVDLAVSALSLELALQGKCPSNPMVVALNQKGSLGIYFNGEVYDYELKKTNRPNKVMVIIADGFYLDKYHNLINFEGKEYSIKLLRTIENKNTDDARQYVEIYDLVPCDKQ